MFDMQFMVRLKYRLLRQRQVWLIPFVLFAVVACTPPKKEMTENDEIGFNCLAYRVDKYVRYNGEFPTKEVFLDANKRDLREFLLGGRFSAERIDQFLADSLGEEMDYLKIWPRLGDSAFLGFEPGPKSSMIIASNYLMTHPSLQFINQDSCLAIADSTLLRPDGSVASINIYWPKILIQDSAYYCYGVRQSSITSLLRTLDSLENAGVYDYDCGASYSPINVAYDSPVELIDTLCYYSGLCCFINKGVDKDELIVSGHFFRYRHRQQVDSIIGMPPISQDSSSKAKEDDFLRFKNAYMDLIRNAKFRLHRSNDTIYMNGNPVDESCRLSADSSVILIDLTHNNTYRDLCELVHFMEKATDSESLEAFGEKGFRWKYYFKTDDKLYKAFEK